LHLGHLVNALFVWGIARAHGGQVVLRIEDHDRLRCRDEYEVALLEDLTWLGLEADIAPTTSYRDGSEAGKKVVPHPFRQSDNSARYTSALERLDQEGLVYACECTRRMIAERAPSAPGEESRYPGTCADGHVDPNSTPARRVRLSRDIEVFDDLRLGRIEQSPAMQCGDVLVRDRHGSWTYQFAVTVDDFEHEIDVVIRGEDLLASTGRQWQMARLLGRATPPLVLHHPLLVHADGSKLSKANRDTSLRERRADGAHAESLLGEAAFLSGLAPSAEPISAREIASLFAC
jgi:glutamyl/glutaminyl-tRNA synthetase